MKFLLSTEVFFFLKNVPVFVLCSNSIFLVYKENPLCKPVWHLIYSCVHMTRQFDNFSWYVNKVSLKSLIYLNKTHYNCKYK